MEAQIIYDDMGMCLTVDYNYLFLLLICLILMLPQLCFHKSLCEKNIYFFAFGILQSHTLQNNDYGVLLMIEFC